MEKVSVIVPAYNAESTIVKCIDSILSQTYSLLEVIVINDGSTDGTAILLHSLEKKDGRLKVYMTKNRGVSCARNAGLKRATGTFILFVDADDYLVPTMVQEMMFYQEQYKNIWCGFQIEYHKETDKAQGIESVVWDKSQPISIIKGNKIIDLIVGQYLNSPWNKLYSKEVIEDNQLEFNVNYNYAEDLLFNIEYLRHTKDEICFINKCLYNYVHQNNASLSTLRGSGQFMVYVQCYTQMKELCRRYRIKKDFTALYVMFLKYFLGELDACNDKQCQQYMGNPVWLRLLDNLWKRRRKLKFRWKLEVWLLRHRLYFCDKYIRIIWRRVL